jgi:hypothetical protein
MMEQITDYITGKAIDNVGSEVSRQDFEKISGGNQRVLQRRDPGG